MHNMKAVTKIEERRERRISQAVAARRRLDRGASRVRAVDPPARAGGRLWVNGIELGGTDPRHTALAASYD
jgi:hypothetical protein